jgi:UDP-N-acetylmuramate--alanine ligase
MNNEKILILRAQKETVDFIDQYKLRVSHKVILFGDEIDKNEFPDIDYLIKDKNINSKGISFSLTFNGKKYIFKISSLPGYLVYNASGAIITAMMLGLTPELIQGRLNKYTGLVRRFDLYKSKNNGIVITDYGHSPESINCIVSEIRKIFTGKKIHLVFQPHLYSRTYNFFNAFIESLSKADKISLIDIFPARENHKDWHKKISSNMLFDELKKLGKNVFYAGPSCNIMNRLIDKIDEKEITCFIGAGDMDLYYPQILASLECRNYFK